MTVHRLFAGHVDLMTARAVRAAIAHIDPRSSAPRDSRAFRDYSADLSVIVTELIDEVCGGVPGGCE